LARSASWPPASTEPALETHMNHPSSHLDAFKRAPSLELSKWYLGSLITNLAETKDTNGAFCLLETTLVPGNEPPPHVHSREDELFYVLEGEFDVYVGETAFNAEAGECIFLPRFTPHAFVIRSPRLRMLTLFSPGGLEEAFRSMSSPAQYLGLPSGALTDSTADVKTEADVVGITTSRRQEPRAVKRVRTVALRRRPQPTCRNHPSSCSNS
jgi:mannose-6-phosphate isomerase-like protein (cupin superfamily)